MIWVIFDEQDRRTAAPAFSLARKSGVRVSLQDYYEKSSLALLFLHEADSLGKACPACWETLRGFAAHREAYRLQGADILAVVRDDYKLSAMDAYPDDLPFPLLSDPAGRVRQKYAAMMAAELAPESYCMAFLLDPYGAPYAAYGAAELDRVALHEEALSWLQYISVQCPE